MTRELKDDFESLLVRFPALRDEIQSSNRQKFDPQDFAKHGFYQISSPNEWTSEHEQVIADRCNRELSNEALIDQGHSAAAWRAFTCLALGYLLALYQKGELVGFQFDAAEMQLAGFMFLLSPKFNEY